MDAEMNNLEIGHSASTNDVVVAAATIANQEEGGGPSGGPSSSSSTATPPTASSSSTNGGDGNSNNNSSNKGNNDVQGEGQDDMVEVKKEGEVKRERERGEGEAEMGAAEMPPAGTAGMANRLRRPNVNYFGDREFTACLQQPTDDHSLCSLDIYKWEDDDICRDFFEEKCLIWRHSHQFHFDWKLQILNEMIEEFPIQIHINVCKNKSF